MNISFHFERSNDGNAEPSFWLIVASPSSSSGRAKKRKDWRVGEERELVKKVPAAAAAGKGGKPSK